MFDDVLSPYFSKLGTNTLVCCCCVRCATLRNHAKPCETLAIEWVGRRAFPLWFPAFPCVQYSDGIMPLNVFSGCAVHPIWMWGTGTYNHQQSKAEHWEVKKMAVKCSDDMWYHVMACDELWWYVMTCDDQWWPTMTNDDLRRNASLEFIGRHWTSLDNIGHHWISLGDIGIYWTSLKYIEIYRNDMKWL